jgi:hypothetical protein
MRSSVACNRIYPRTMPLCSNMRWIKHKFDVCCNTICASCVTALTLRVNLRQCDVACLKAGCIWTEFELADCPRSALASATVTMSASAKPGCKKAKSSGKAKTKAAPEAKKAKPKAAKTARGSSQPLTVGQYDLLLDWCQWRYPRAPEKRADAEKMPKEFAPRVALHFRSTKNFSSTQPSAFLAPC